VAKRRRVSPRWVIFVAFSESQRVASRPEFQFMCAKFSTGVTLKELRSIAAVVAHLSGVKGPSRNVNRNRLLLLQWFMDYWRVLSPWLALTHLRDSDGRVIDGSREFFEAV
jgi:hypothetical protein